MNSGSSKLAPWRAVVVCHVVDIIASEERSRSCGRHRSVSVMLPPSRPFCAETNASPVVTQIIDPFGGFITSQDHATAVALTLLKSQQGRPRGRLKDIVHTLAAQTGAFKVFSGTDLSGSRLAVMLGYEALRLLAHFFDGDWILAQILLETDKYDWYVGAFFSCLLNPLWYAAMLVSQMLSSR